MQLGISEILKKISEEKDAKKRKDMMASCINNQGVLHILKLAYDPNITFNLPQGEPPYKPCQYGDQQPMLYNSLRKMYLFIGEGNPGVSKAKREVLFVNMLEALDPDDAKLIVAVKDKKLPYKNITKKFVTDVFAGLISDEQK